MIYLAAIVGFVASMFTAGTIGGFLTGLATSVTPIITNVSITLVLNGIWIAAYVYANKREHYRSNGVVFFQGVEIFICALFVLMLFFVDSAMGRIGFAYVAALSIVNFFLLEHYQIYGDPISPDIEKTVPEINKTATVDAPKEVSIQTVLDLLDMILKTDSYPALEETRKYLAALQGKDIPVKKVMLSQIYSLLTTYQSCLNEPVESKSADQAKTHITEAFVIVNQALSKIYDNAFAAKTFDVDAEIAALTEKMEQDNLIDSDKLLKF